MKKSTKFTRIITIFLTVIFSFGIWGCSCGTNNSDSDTDNDGTRKSAEIHNYDVNDGTIDFFKNGVSEFTIVYPKDEYTGDIVNGVMELQSLIFEATGVYLPIKSDSVVAGTTNVLSVGKTVQAMSNKTVSDKLATENLSRDGYIVYSQGSTVYMVGNSDTGSLYACYEFLKWQLNFEFYASDEWSLLKDVKDIKLKTFDIVDVPAFMSRTPANGESTVLGATTRNRFRATPHEGWLFNNYNGNKWCDNFDELIPKSKYMAEHPDWFGTDGKQLCLTARGDEQELLALRDAVVYEMTYRLEAQPEKNWMSFSMEDGGFWCECEACTREYGQYDYEQSAAFAVYIRFTNMIAKEIKAWNKENCPERDIKIFIYNYGKCRFAPVKLDANKKPVEDANGNYMPYSDDLILEDNVGVIFCTAWNTATYYNLEHEYNVETTEQAKRLTAIMSNPTFYVWTYSSYMHDYLLPDPNTHTRQNYYQWALDLGAIAIYDQAVWTTAGTTDFGALKTYISAKLAFNTTLNVNELTENFFDNYYKDAAPVMKSMYADYRSYMEYLAQNKGFKGNTVTMTVHKDKANWPYQRVQKFLSYIDEAYKVIEPLKETDPETYQKLHDRIMKEGITYRYMLLILHPENYSFDILSEMKKQFKNDCLYLGINEYMEHGSIDNLFV